MLTVGCLIAKPILGLLDTPASIMPLAVSYLKLYFLGMPFLMIYDFGNAVLRAVGDTKRPFVLFNVFGNGQCGFEPDFGNWLSDEFGWNGNCYDHCQCSQRGFNLPPLG